LNLLNLLKGKVGWGAQSDAILRAKPGSELVVVNGNGWGYLRQTVPHLTTTIQQLPIIPRVQTIPTLTLG